MHAVAGVDVVFDQDRNAVQRAAPAALVELSCDGQGIGIELDDGVDLFIDRGDALELEFCRLHGRYRARAQIG